MDAPAAPFDRETVRRRRDRAAPEFAQFGFLVDHAAAGLADRLADVKRTFPMALDLGAHDGRMRGHIFDAAPGASRHAESPGHGGVEFLAHCDLSAAMIDRAAGPRFVADEEMLPVARESLDLVVSALSLHWVNDLPGALLQIRQALKPDGLLLATMLGGDTLIELRECLAEAEIAVENGLSPRVSPFAETRDAGALLQRAGFALPVVDREVLTVTYRSAPHLMRDLRGMGETNAIDARRRGFSRRATIMHAAQLYAERFPAEDGRVRATFEILTLTGWAPHASQQKPLRPGSAAARLADALGTTEESLGEKPGR